MEILYLILKVCAILGLFALMFLPLHDVTAWDDDSWYARFTVSALATVVWVGFILFLPGYWVVYAVMVAVLLLFGLFHPALRNLLPFWRWALALRHRIKGDSPEFVVERVLALRPIEDATTDFKGVRDYTASYSSYEDGEAMLDFTCQISGVTDDFVDKQARLGLGAMGAETYKIDHIGPGHWMLHFYETTPKNPLDESKTIKASDLADWNGRTVTYGMTEAGDFAKLSYAQTSGIVVGGVPVPVSLPVQLCSRCLCSPLRRRPLPFLTVRAAWIGHGRNEQHRSTTTTVTLIWRLPPTSWNSWRRGA